MGLAPAPASAVQPALPLILCAVAALDGPYPWSMAVAVVVMVLIRLMESLWMV